MGTSSPLRSIKISVNIINSILGLSISLLLILSLIILYFYTLIPKNQNKSLGLTNIHDVCEYFRTYIVSLNL